MKKERAHVHKAIMRDIFDEWSADGHTVPEQLIALPRDKLLNFIHEYYVGDVALLCEHEESQRKYKWENMPVRNLRYVYNESFGNFTTYPPYDVAYPYFIGFDSRKLAFLIICMENDGILKGSSLWSICEDTRTEEPEFISPCDRCPKKQPNKRKKNTAK